MSGAEWEIDKYLSNNVSTRYCLEVLFVQTCHRAGLVALRNHICTISLSKGIDALKEVSEHKIWLP